MIEIDDLDGSGKMQVGLIPDPDGSVSEDHFEHGPFPTSAPSLRVHAKTERLGGLDGSHVGGGIRVADRPSFRVHPGLCEHTAELALARAGTLALDPAGTALRFGGNNWNLDAIHQHIHLWYFLFQNHGQDELFGAAYLPIVPLSDRRANRLGGAF